MIYITFKSVIIIVSLKYVLICIAMFLLVLASYYHVINVKMHFAVACLGRVLIRVAMRTRGYENSLIRVTEFSVVGLIKFC
jgi:hypothetical protein